MNLSTSGLVNPNYSVYPVSSSEAFLIETDTISGTSPYVTIADMKQQVGQPFVTGAMSGAMAGGTSGQFLNGSYLPYVSVIQIVPTAGLGNFQFSLADNTAGTVTNTNGTPFSVTYTSDQFGRVDTAGFTVNSVFQPVLYLVSSDEAYAVSMLSGGPILGHLEPQTPSTFTAKTIQGTLVEGTSAPAVSADRDLSGFLTFDGTSLVGRNAGREHHRCQYTRRDGNRHVCTFRHRLGRRQRNRHLNCARSVYRRVLYCVADEDGDDHHHDERCEPGADHRRPLD
jgi:hypothetical protein